MKAEASLLPTPPPAAPTLPPPRGSVPSVLPRHGPPRPESFILYSWPAGLLAGEFGSQGQTRAAALRTLKRSVEKQLRCKCQY